VARGRSDDAASSLVSVVLLNLCLLLPLVTVLWRIVHAARAMMADEAATVESALRQVPPLVVPVAVWRVDMLVLVVLGLVLLPVSLGRWSLGRYEGIGLITGYGLYLAMIAMLVR
jgi:Ca2+/Na+ antiporter